MLEERSMGRMMLELLRRIPVRKSRFRSAPYRDGRKPPTDYKGVSEGQPGLELLERKETAFPKSNEPTEGKKPT